MSPEALIYFVVTLIIVGLVLYLLEAYVPLSPPIKVVLRVVIVLILILWLLRFLGLIAPLHAQVRAITPTSPAGLIAAYAMSNTLDASGNGHTATFSNTMTVPGKYNEGQLFAGGTGASRMTVPNIAFTSAFTLEAWVRFTAATRMAVGTRSPRDAPVGWQAVIYKTHDIVWLAEAGGVVLGGFTPQGAADSLGLVSPTAITLNVFHHLALTYDGATLALVIDGVQVASRPATGMVQPSTQPLEVGGSATDAGGLQGVIDDVRIYSRALSVSEINTDLGTPVDTTKDPVVGWNFEVFGKGATDAQPGTPIALASVQKTQALCGQPPLVPPVGPVKNPTIARVTDPDMAGKECELVIESFVLGLPIGTGYTSAASAVGQTGTTSARSSLSNAFDRVAIVEPPLPPSPPPVVK